MTLDTETLFVPKVRVQSEPVPKTEDNADDSDSTKGSEVADQSSDATCVPDV